VAAAVVEEHSRGRLDAAATALVLAPLPHHSVGFRGAQAAVALERSHNPQSGMIRAWRGLEGLTLGPYQRRCTPVIWQGNSGRK
jgi:hypothetical protein